MPILQDIPTHTPPRSTAPPSLLDWLLADQQQLTAVEQFSFTHTLGDRPAQEQHYSRLLPASPPAAGQQYAFEVNLDRCSGCKACVTACHSLNGLDKHETWRDVGLLTGGSRSAPVMQHVTTACHHCLDPACMIACPVDAYEKDPRTGIVKHLDDQCFGCQYCTLACPYDVPKYHAAKGIVRKCDMCSSRLAVGEAPACVQACPHEAIAIRIVDKQQVIDDAEANLFLPAAPEPHITYPTTTYKTSRVFPRNLLPADYHAVNPQHPHWPLIVMLVLTQLSVGAFAVGLMLERFLPADLIATLRPAHAVNALLFGLLALGASTMHLGRPQYAFRAFIGLRHSWLSREILAFTLFAGLACAYAGLAWWGVGSTTPLVVDVYGSTGVTEYGSATQPPSTIYPSSPPLPHSSSAPAQLTRDHEQSTATTYGSMGVGEYGSTSQSASSFYPPTPSLPHSSSAPARLELTTTLGGAVALTGLAGIFCSIMIYVFTQREFWNPVATGGKFLLTAAILGTSATWMTLLLLATLVDTPATAALVRECGPLLCRLLIAFTAIKLTFEAALFRKLANRRNNPLKRSAQLMLGPLSNHTLARFAAGLLGGVAMPALLLSHLADTGESVTSPVLLVMVAVQFAATLLGELMERYLFFAAVAAPRMPGAVRG